MLTGKSALPGINQLFKCPKLTKLTVLRLNSNLLCGKGVLPGMNQLFKCPKLTKLTVLRLNSNLLCGKGVLQFGHFEAKALPLNGHCLFSKICCFTVCL